MDKILPPGGCLPLPRGYIHVYFHDIQTSSLKRLGHSKPSEVGTKIILMVHKVAYPKWQSAL